MTLSKYSKRHVQFEALEAKQLFAADLVGGAAADLPDTSVVAGFDPGDLVAEIDPGSLSSVQINSGDAVVEISDPSSPVNSLKSKTSMAMKSSAALTYGGQAIDGYCSIHECGGIDTTTDQTEVFFAQYGKFQHQILRSGGFFNVDMDDHDTDPHFQGENVWDPNVELGMFSVKEADVDDLQFLIEDLQDADYQFEVVNIGCGGTGKLEVLENGLLRNCPARPQLPKK